MKYFRESEFDDFGKMNPDLIDRLEALRAYVATPIIITSSTGGVHEPNSEHYKGNAVDIMLPNTPKSLLDQYLAVERFGFHGVGVYPHWQYADEIKGGFHLDLRDFDDSFARWIGIREDGKNQYIALNAENLLKYLIN